MPSGEMEREIVRSDPPVSGERAEKISGRRERFSRSAIRVDEVEVQALSLAAGIITPRRVAAKLDIKSAPLEPREAFLLELIDGRSNADDLADLTGMTRAEVLTALRRLEGLGFVKMGR
jgi:hypothetical protein